MRKSGDGCWDMHLERSIVYRGLGVGPMTSPSTWVVQSSLTGNMTVIGNPAERCVGTFLGEGEGSVVVQSRVRGCGMRIVRVR